MRAKLEIIFEDDGRVTVNGPLDDFVLCYGLLGAADKIVASREQRREPGRLGGRLPLDSDGNWKAPE